MSETNRSAPLSGPPLSAPPLSARPESKSIQRRRRNSRAALRSTAVLSALFATYYVVGAAVIGHGSNSAWRVAGEGVGAIVITALVMLAVGRYWYSRLPWSAFGVAIISVVTYVLVLGAVFSMTHPGSSGRTAPTTGTPNSSTSDKMEDLRRLTDLRISRSPSPDR